MIGRGDLPLDEETHAHKHTHTHHTHTPHARTNKQASLREGLDEETVHRHGVRAEGVFADRRPRPCCHYYFVVTLFTGPERLTWGSCVGWKARAAAGRAAVAAADGGGGGAAASIAGAAAADGG